MNIVLRIIFPILIATCYSSAHDIGVLTPRFHLDCLSINDGLSLNEVNCTIQDQYGLMWFGTDNGLNCFDGYRFIVYRHNVNTPFSITDNKINTLYLDRKGILWIGTSKGLEYFDTTNNGFRYFRPINIPLSEDTLAAISGLFEDSMDNFWVVMPKVGLFKFNRDQKKFFLLSDSPEFNNLTNFQLTGPICECPDGLILLGTTQGSVQLDLKNNKILENSLPTVLKNRSVRALTLGRDNTLWIGFDDFLLGIPKQKLSMVDKNLHLPDGIAKDDPYNSVFLSRLPVDVHLSSIYEDDEGQLWIGTQGGGIFIYQKETGKFKSFRPCKCLKDTGGLSSTWINNIFQNATGTFWVCTSEGIGKFTYNTQLFTNYQMNERDSTTICAGEIRAIGEDREGNILLGTWGNGLCKLDIKNETFSHIKYSDQKSIRLSNINIGALLEDSKGNIWIGTDSINGLIRYNPATNELNNYFHLHEDSLSLSNNLVTCLFEDKNKNLWVGTGGGGLNLYDHQNDGFTHYVYNQSKSNSISDNYIYTIIQDNQANLWIGTRNHLNRFIQSESKFIRYHHQPLIPGTLPADEIYSLHQEKNGILWIGTNQGLAYLPPENFTDTVFFSITEKHELAGNAIFGILSDNQSILWLLTNKGLSSFDPSTSVVRNFSSDDGCVKFSKTISGGSNAYLRAKNGDMYFGGVNGLTLYRPRRSNRVLIKPPPIVITDIMLNNQVIEKCAWLTNSVEIPSGYQSFSFEFAALDYAASLSNEYAYKLEGFDQDWIYCGNQRHASYASVNPGVYQFKVKGAGHDGVWNEQGVMVHVTILPQIWAQPWFQISLIGLFGLFLFFTFIYREHAQKRSRESQQLFSQKLIESQEEERKRISSELHDSLGQNLLMISHELARDTQIKSKKIKRDPSVLTMIKDAIEEVREIAYNLHPYQLEKLGLKNGLESIIKKATHASKIDFISMIDEIDDLFTKETRIYYFRIVQEAITNICKHSGANRAIIHIERGRNHLITTIQDNGKGFFLKDQEIKDHGGLGIVNMKERTRLLHGTFEIHNNTMGGSCIKIKIPIEKSTQQGNL